MYLLDAKAFCIDCSWRTEGKNALGNGARHHKKTGLPKSAIRMKSRKPLTVNDLLARDDLNEFLADMEKAKPDIKHAIIIWIDRKDNYSWEMTEGILTSQAIWLLEKTKLDLLMPEREEE